MSTPRETAIKAVKKAGAEILKLAESEINYDLKSAHDIVAEGDLLSEKILLESLQRAFPTYGFLSEEAGKQDSSDFMWIIDPIDGTINFSRHIDEYCISLALAHKEEVELGIIYQPSHDLLYVAEKGQGAYLNNKKMEVSTKNKLVSTLIATDTSSNVNLRKANFDLLSKISTEVRQLRIFGSAALHLAKVAEGKLDGYFKASSNYWDNAAGVLLIREAGGKVTDFNRDPIAEDSKSIVATNSLIHEELMGLLQ